jgi:NDP-sugar pyrophosphorylase family protein
MEALNAFILAAGLGERLRPITWHIPKPLLPILGRPALQYVLEALQSIPVERIGINLHYGGDVIAGWVRGSMFGDRVELFYENELLGTGGALKNAGDLLGGRTFIVHNSDIITDMDLGRLIEHHLSTGNIATLAVHDYPPFNSLEIDCDGLLRGVKSPASGPGLLAFTGIAVYSPGFLDLLPGGVGSVIEGWLNAISRGLSIGTFNIDGCRWYDIGTPSSYADAVFGMLRQQGETFYIHPTSTGCEHALLEGCVVVEGGCSIGRDVLLRDCIVLPGVSIRDRGVYRDAIIGCDFTIDISPGPNTGEGLALIGSGGSDRRYYRIGDGRGVLMCDNNKEEFTRTVEYTRFFRRHSVPVPGLRGVDNGGMTAVFEDLGDVSLYNWLRCPRSDEAIEEVYKRALDILILIHTVVTENVSECPLLNGRVFDYGHFRWESEYFIREFVRGLRRMDIADSHMLDDELKLIAHRADSFKKTIIHRDFQSQNIMVTRDGLYILDYQGARMGPPAYDVASLLWDPYYPLEERLRQRLLDYYISRMSRSFKIDGFMESLSICRLQRHMQALGAYAFLSMKKGKRHFLKHIPEGLRLLKEDVEALGDEYKTLYRLIMSL